jgi:hypothetical protein
VKRSVGILTEMVYQLGDFDRKRHPGGDKFRRPTLGAFLELVVSGMFL